MDKSFSCLGDFLLIKTSKHPANKNSAKDNVQEKQRSIERQNVILYF